MVNSNEEIDKEIEQAEAIHLVFQLEIRKQLKESGASLAEVDDTDPITHSEERIEELKKIAEEMLSAQKKGDKT